MEIKHLSEITFMLLLPLYFLPTTASVLPLLSCGRHLEDMHSVWVSVT